MAEQTTRRTSSRRKTTPDPAPDEPATPAVDEAVEPPKAAASDGFADDDRIGTACPEGWASVAYDDGRAYRCEGGRHVERTR